MGPRGAVGVLAIVPADARALQIPEARHQLETFANQTALAIERALLADEARRAEVRAETERMRNSLLSSVSHDLRTPLATIIGASSGLLDGADRLDPATRRELSAPFTERPSHLDRLVNSLLEMTRLESGAIADQAGSLRRWTACWGPRSSGWKRSCATGRCASTLPADLPLVPIDALLVQQVFLESSGQCDAVLPPRQPDRISTIGGRAHVWWSR